jgi:glucosamine kinase
MREKIAASDASHFIGIDGGGTKTDCVLLDADGRVVARAVGGPSNPLRGGYAKAWFSLSEAADLVLRHGRITAEHVGGVCAGLGGAGREVVVRQVMKFLQGSFPNAQIRVTTDLEIALEAAWGAGEGMILLAGTGSAALGRDASGRLARAGGRGPWIGDEGSAFDIGRQAVRAVALAEENRGPATLLSKRIFQWHRGGWELLQDAITKNADDVFPKIFPLVAELADDGDGVSREILLGAAVALAELAACVAAQLGWLEREVAIGKVGGAHGRSEFLDAALEEELQRVIPQARLVSPEISPAEAAARIAFRLARVKGHAA